jgi:D-aminopeptidase
MTELKSVLLVTDLAGVTGVTDLDALYAENRKYKNACRALLCEVGAVCRGLLERGVETIVILDTHRNVVEGGSLDCKSLPAQCRLLCSQDLCSPDLFTGIDALVAIGMHGAAGTQSFAAQTVGLHCDWWRAGQRLSESDLVLALAHEASVPTLFFAGDSHLGQSLKYSVEDELAFFSTKTSLSVESCQSLSIAETEPELYRLAKDTQPRLLRPSCIGCGADEPLLIGFKSAWQADLAHSLGQVTRVSSHWLATVGTSFQEHCAAALKAVHSVTESCFNGMTKRTVSSESYLWSVRQLLMRAVPSPSRSENSLLSCIQAFDQRWSLRDRVQAAWSQFDQLTNVKDVAAVQPDEEYRLALRALVCHMAQSWCPSLLAGLHLSPHLGCLLDQLSQLPQDYPQGLSVSQAMSRIDAAYLLKRHGRNFTRPNRIQLRGFVERIGGEQTLSAWMISELAKHTGCALGLNFVERPYRVPQAGFEPDVQRMWDLYWLTHELLFASDYLTLTKQKRFSQSFCEELLDWIPWVISNCIWDLAAEISLCLLYLGEEQTPRTVELMGQLLENQSADGTLRDHSMTQVFTTHFDHPTGLMLLMLGKILEMRG